MPRVVHVGPEQVAVRSIGKKPAKSPYFVLPCIVAVMVALHIHVDVVGHGSFPGFLVLGLPVDGEGVEGSKITFYWPYPAPIMFA